MTDSSNDARFVPSVYPSRRSLFTARISPIAAMKSIDSRRDASSCGARSPVAPRVSFDCRSIYTNDLSRSSRVAVHPSIVYPDTSVVVAPARSRTTTFLRLAPIQSRNSAGIET